MTKYQFLIFIVLIFFAVNASETKAQNNNGAINKKRIIAYLQAYCDSVKTQPDDVSHNAIVNDIFRQDVIGIFIDTIFYNKDSSLAYFPVGFMLSTESIVGQYVVIPATTYCLDSAKQVRLYGSMNSFGDFSLQRLRLKIDNFMKKEIYKSTTLYGAKLNSSPFDSNFWDACTLFKKHKTGYYNFEISYLSEAPEKIFLADYGAYPISEEFNHQDNVK